MEARKAEVVVTLGEGEAAALISNIEMVIQYLERIWRNRQDVEVDTIRCRLGTAVLALSHFANDLRRAPNVR